MTRRKKKLLELRQPGDSARWVETANWVEADNVPAERRTRYQLKVGPWSFYPDTGTFNRDEEPSEPERGLEAFKKLVEAMLVRRELEKIL